MTARIGLVTGSSANSIRAGRCQLAGAVLPRRVAAGGTPIRMSPRSTAMPITTGSGIWVPRGPHRSLRHGRPRRRRTVSATGLRQCGHRAATARPVHRTPLRHPPVRRNRGRETAVAAVAGPPMVRPGTAGRLRQAAQCVKIALGPLPRRRDGRFLTFPDRVSLGVRCGHQIARHSESRRWRLLVRRRRLGQPLLLRTGKPAARRQPCRADAVAGRRWRRRPHPQGQYLRGHSRRRHARRRPDQWPHGRRQLVQRSPAAARLGVPC